MAYWLCICMVVAMDCVVLLDWYLLFYPPVMFWVVVIVTVGLNDCCYNSLWELPIWYYNGFWELCQVFFKKIFIGCSANRFALCFRGVNM